MKTRHKPSELLQDGFGDVAVGEDKSTLEKYGLRGKKTPHPTRCGRIVSPFIFVSSVSPPLCSVDDRQYELTI
jgi:hypothetical protein